MLQMSLMAATGEEQMEGKKRWPVAQEMQERRKEKGTATGREITGLLALAGLPRVGRWCGEGTGSRRWESYGG